MIKSVATAAALLTIAGAALSTPSLAVGPRPGGDPLEWCLLSGGTNIPQPPGSSIAACCVEGEGCVICAADWSDCTYDPPYGLQGSQAQFPGGADRLAPPEQSGGSGPGATQFAPLLNTR